MKAVRSMYFPLDRDIVREMWVKGDLKKRLGLKPSKDAEGDALNRDVETAPIRGYHDRSTSAASRYEMDYEPAYMDSPGEYEMTPPQTVGVGDRSRRDDWRGDDRIVSYVIEGDPDESSILRPGPHASPRIPVSPSPSYYSASDIPPPSPLPEPQYLYYSPGPSTAPSIASPLSHVAPSSSPRMNLEVPNQPPTRNDVSTREGVEMRSRVPPSAFPTNLLSSQGAMTRAASRASDTSGHPRAASRASEHSRYATASEGWSDDDTSTINHDRPGSTYSTSPRAL